MFNKYKPLFEILKCVNFGEFPLPNGRISPYKIDIDEIASTQREIEFLASQSIKFSGHNGFKPDYFVGVPSGATQIGVEATKQIDWISPDEKKIVIHEKNREYDYYNAPIAHGDKVVVIEDVVTTGNSVKQEVENLGFEGANVLGAISIVDRLESKDNFDFPYSSMITIDEIFDVLKRQNKIPEAYREKTEQYVKLNVRHVA